MFTKKQLLYKRSYMKVQELAANVGGIFKFVSQIFGILAHFTGKWFVDNELVSTFFKLEEREEPGIEEDANRSDSKIVRQKKLKEIKVGFCRFVANSMCCRKGKFKQARENIGVALDVKEIYKNYLKIEFLCNHLLNEETLKELDSSIMKDLIEKKKSEPKENEVRPVRIVVRRNE